MDPHAFESSFEKFTSNLNQWIPDGLLHVDLPMLEQFGLLAESSWHNCAKEEEQLINKFQVTEGPDRVTMLNDQFIVWIIPQRRAEPPFETLTLVARFHDKVPHLELGYTTKGVYNTPKYILKILRHILKDVIETDTCIADMEKPSN